MGMAEWGGNPVCWWFGLYFCFVCCLDEAFCVVCYWWLGIAGSCIQMVSFVWVLTVWYFFGTLGSWSQFCSQVSHSKGSMLDLWSGTKIPQEVSVQFSSVDQLCPTVCDPMDCSMSGFSVLRYLLQFAQTHVHWVRDAIQPSHPLSFPSPSALSLYQNQNLFQWISSCISWSKYWSFSFSISPSNEYLRLISLRIDWFDLLPVQGTLKSLLQHHSLKPSILWCSAFFMVQLHIHTWLLEKS